ncbi:MAG: YbjN domain-containing protein [Cellulomonas sp.]|uniref:hypothetical protein n=1 Tax=Cellulomonas sp. TaxID=40001 RepID=UPI00258A17EB|nr:hypothetical protein [Cellulomonas sp.]MCR6705637.1 YbjN domain-containing protein [Cellulomonas sp.]
MSLTDDDLFYARVVAAFVDAGRTATPDAASRTLDVASDLPGGRVLAVVRPAARSVTLYAVWPTIVPADAVPAVTELVVRANADLFVATLELDLPRATVAARAAVALGELDPPDDALGHLLVTALAETEQALTAYAPALEAVLAGTPPAVAAAAAYRSALDVEEQPHA